MIKRRRTHNSSSAVRSPKLPALKLSVTRRNGAPRRPSRDELAKVFAQAWSLLSPDRLPDLQERTAIAVDVLIVDDSEIAQLNVSHLKVAGPTDVLSFPMGEVDPERNAFNLGEIVVSFETAFREAAERQLHPHEELARYCVHGFLHLLGYDDATAAQRKDMFDVQERALRLR